MEFISGENRGQTLLLPDCLDDYVDGNNVVRIVDAYINNLNLAELGFNKPEPNDTGRPMYDPKDMLKLYVYGYMNRTRSSRGLEKESKRNLEVLWLLGRLSPDHKTIARFRSENAAALKRVFIRFVKFSEGIGLYGKELVAIDGSKFKAVNSRSHNFTKKQINDKIGKITEKIDEYMKGLDRNDEAEGEAGSEKSGEEIAKIIRELRESKERYQGYAAELERTGEKQKSLTDGDSRLMPVNGKMDVCYNVQTAVDAKNKLIVDFQVTNQVNDKNFITPLAGKVQEVLGTEGITAVVDAGYESILDIVSAAAQGVDVHVAGTDFDICLPAKEGEGEEITTHHEGRCVYIAERNISLCPMGNVLYPVFHTTSKKKGGVGVFYNYEACEQCTCKCTDDKRGRFRHKVPMARENFSREHDEEGLQVKQVRIKPDKAIIRQRKSIIEHVFGTVKRGMQAEHLLTKGLEKVTGEFSLTYLAYNIKRAINILGYRKLMAGMA